VSIDHRDGSQGGAAAPEAVTSQQLTAHTALVNTYADGFSSYINAFEQWAEWAGQMENNNGSSQLVRRTEFNFTNKCQQAWIQLNGNRSQEEMQKGEGGERRTVRFSARENVAYWEGQWFGSHNTEKNTFVNEETGEIINTGDNDTVTNGLKDEPDGMWGPSYKKQNAAVRYEEAKLNFNMCKAEFEMYNEMYGLITGKAYEYKPYAEDKSRLETAPTQQGSNLAARAMGKLTPTSASAQVWPIVKKAAAAPSAA
jgi:hypothetical protein